MAVEPAEPAQGSGRIGDICELAIWQCVSGDWPVFITVTS